MILFEPQELFNKAIIRKDGDCAVYSLQKLIELLIEYDKMDYDGALDWVLYNMQNTGFEDWPVIVNDLPNEDHEN
jgi:hypothetical protein